MSIHPNPDQTQTEGMKIEPNGTFIGHTLGIAIVVSSQIGASVAAAITKGANQAIIQADGTAAVSYTLDGTTTPTTAAGGGLLIPAGGSITLNMTDAAAAKFIQRAATTVLNVLYTM